MLVYILVYTLNIYLVCGINLILCRGKSFRSTYTRETLGKKKMVDKLECQFSVQLKEFYACICIYLYSYYQYIGFRYNNNTVEHLMESPISKTNYFGNKNRF